MTTTEPKPASTEAKRRSRVLIALPDVFVALALGTLAFLLRRHVPADGLFYDDAWQALGAVKGSLSNLLTVGQTQPGFTFGLMAWTRVFGTGTESLVTPQLIAGTLGPPVLYLVLRRFGFARSVSVFVGATLTVSRVHVVYSYHVKTYTWDVLLVLMLALVVWRLAPRHWSRSTAVAWFAGSVIVATFSSIALLATGTAGAILVLHPKGDRKVRMASVGAQLVGLLAIYAASSRTYSTRLIRLFFDERGGFIAFTPNPVRFGRAIFDHLWNVAQVFPGGRPSLSLVAAVVGLAFAAWRGPLVVPARFLGLMALLALAGGVTDRIPFGPPFEWGRVSLWLIPAIAFGIGTALELCRRLVAGRAILRLGFDAIALVAAVLVLINGQGFKYGYPAGARAATRQVMDRLGPHDAVIITWPTTYSFALNANTSVKLRATPDLIIGFQPAFSDRRIHPYFRETTEKQFNDFVKGADRVYVVHAVIFSPNMHRYLFDLAVKLRIRGFVPVGSTKIATGNISLWRRTTP